MYIYINQILIFINLCNCVVKGGARDRHLRCGRGVINVCDVCFKRGTEIAAVTWIFVSGVSVRYTVATNKRTVETNNHTL